MKDEPEVVTPEREDEAAGYPPRWALELFKRRAVALRRTEERVRPNAGARMGVESEDAPARDGGDA